MLELGTESDAPRTVDPAYGGGTQLGKRYVHEASGLEVLCTKAGDGSLSVGTERARVEGHQGAPELRLSRCGAQWSVGTVRRRIRSLE